MAVRMEDITKRLMDLAVDGVGMWGVSKAIEYIKPYTVKMLKQYNDPALKLSLSLVDLVLPQIKQLPYVGDWLGLIGRRGVEDFLYLIVDKKPTCWAEDENTIKCVNFDTTSVSVKIDKVDVTPSISGTAEELTLSLPSPLSAGAHDLVVTGDTKSWSGKIYV